MKFSCIVLWLAVLTGLAGCGQGDVKVPATQTSDARKVAKDARTEKDKSQAPAGQDPIDRHVGRLILTKHVRCRMGCRHITEHEIREILERGEINYRKSDPNGHPDPKYALEGQTEEGQHLRVIFAVPTGRAGVENSLVVVTCIELGVEWKCDCK